MALHLVHVCMLVLSYGRSEAGMYVREGIYFRGYFYLYRYAQVRWMVKIDMHVGLISRLEYLGMVCLLMVAGRPSVYF